ncbi:MAG: YopX family protein [Patescibacteria group bacterium]
MNSEIKFRAQNIHSGDWYFYTLHDLIYHGLVNPNEFKNWCRYTGVTDMNGTEIYEGDILQYHGATKVGKPLNPIIFKRGRFWIEPKGREGAEGRLNANYFGTPSFAKMHEIVGNIFTK